MKFKSFRFGFDDGSDDEFIGTGASVPADPAVRPQQSQRSIGRATSVLPPVSEANIRRYLHLISIVIISVFTLLSFKEPCRDVWRAWKKPIAKKGFGTSR